jgi:hypothetical protein
MMTPATRRRLLGSAAFLALGATAPRVLGATNAARPQAQPPSDLPICHVATEAEP